MPGNHSIIPDTLSLLDEKVPVAVGLRQQRIKSFGYPG
jgi:hypothetical protein